MGRQAKKRINIILKRVVAGLLATISLAGSLATPVMAATGQSVYLGTKASNGSPLVSNSFTSDNWDSWEMLCFGVFLSNFCEPFVDDFSSAFSENATEGSKGAGLTALQFSTGGDSQSEEYLTDMLKYCINSQTSSSTMRAIKVRYRMYEYGEEQTDGDLADLGTRNAYLSDLIPTIDKYESGSAEISNTADTKSPRVAYQELTFSSTRSDGDSSASSTSSSNLIPVIRWAMLPIFTVGSTSSSVSVSELNNSNSSGSTSSSSDTIFDLADGLDIMTLQSILATSFNEELKSEIKAGKKDADSSDEGTLDYLINKNPQLYMDAFGNICIQDNGRFVIVIPASANHHIHAQSRYNWVNSIIVNNFVLSSTENKVVASSRASSITQNENVDFGGNPVSHESVEDSDMDDAKILVTTSTMTKLYAGIYEAIREETDKSSRDASINPDDIDDAEDGVTTNIDLAYSDASAVSLNNGSKTYYDAGDGLFDLMSDDVFGNADIQLVVTGVNASVWETGWFFSERDTESRALPVTMGCLMLLANTYPATSSEDDLAEVIQWDAGTTREQTTQTLFEEGSSYYLTPHEDTNSAQKLFINYALKILSGQTTLSATSASLTDEDLNRYREKIKGYSDATDVMQSIYITYYDDITTLEADGNMSRSSTVPSPFMKGFVEKYYDLTTSELGTLLTISSYNDLDAKDYTATKKIRSSYRSLLYKSDNSSNAAIDFVQEGLNLTLRDIAKTHGGTPLYISPNKKELDWVVRVIPPASYFNIASQVFNVDTGLQFELYTPQIYISYLNWYGMLDSDTSSNNFNQTLFSGSDWLSFTAENFESAMTEEEREEETKLNTYKLLSTGTTGKEYRKTWFKSIQETLFVEPFSESLDDGSSLIGEETKLLDVNTTSNNILVSSILENWTTLARRVWFFLMIVIVFSGLFNHKGITWFLSLAVTVAATVYVVPYYLTITPTLCNKLINSLFMESSTYWMISESIRNDANEEQAEAISDDAKIQALLAQLNFLDTDTSLTIKLDISRKVLDATSDLLSYDVLQRTTSLRWLLPTMMKQISAADGSYDYVSIPVSELYSNFSNTYNYYFKTQYQSYAYSQSNNSKWSEDYSSDNPDGLRQLPSLEEKDGTATDTNDAVGTYRWSGYKDTSSSALDVTQTTKSITRINPDTDNVHTAFYLLQGLTLDSPFTSNYSSDKESLSIKEWYEYMANMQNDATNQHYTAGNYDTQFAKYWSNTLESAMTEYNRYQMKQPQQAGYLHTTEGLGTYFYTVALDTFKEYESARSRANIILNLQGSIGTDSAGNEVRQSFMHYGNTGYLRDFLDMEEVFTNLMPYLYQLQAMACGDGETEGLLGDLKIQKGNYYQDNYASWAYRSNWVTKIYEDKLYGSPVDVTYTDNAGATQTATIKFPCDPRSYPDGRPMVFCEAQQMEQGLTDKQLTNVELKLVELGKRVEERYTYLLNYANMSDMTSETLYRAMALEAWLQFNQTFTNDNIVVSAKMLYPVSYDLRDISFITLFRSMMGHITGNNTYMSGDPAQEIFDDYGLMVMFVVWFMVFCMRTVFPFAREWFLALQLLFCVISIILNVTSTYGDRIKAAVGWAITTIFFTAITGAYYLMLSMFMKDPVSDKVVNIGQITGSIGAGFSLCGIALMIIIVSIAYAIGTFYFVFCLITKRHGLSIKDGGFGFFYSLAGNTFGKLGNTISNGFNKVHKGMGGQMQKKKEEVKVKNDKNDPVNTKSQGGSVGTKDTGRKADDYGTEKRENINISATETGGEKAKVVTEDTTATINKEIEKGMSMDSGTTGGTGATQSNNTPSPTTGTAA